MKTSTLFVLVVAIASSIMAINCQDKCGEIVARGIEQLSDEARQEYASKQLDWIEKGDSRILPDIPPCMFHCKAAMQNSWSLGFEEGGLCCCVRSDGSPVPKRIPYGAYKSL